ncbi:hypothetical protein [Halorarum salinum]|uniref:Uncharacterized protein n=1 Tax=Halorarum salinum TaxID=2743089 RepID=A0A7D5QEZ6_9EURY|nr:hypothetical protein [Halobaculum salinum]QLG60264.1 hypothetical protein HUG12_00175 [Halobaculum salinum]
MNRRDFVLTALGVSGTVAAGGAYALDVNPSAGSAQPSGTEAAQHSPTDTATPADAESATDAPTETETQTETTTTQRNTPTETDDDGGFGDGDDGDDDDDGGFGDGDGNDETETPTGTSTRTSTSTPSGNPRDGIEVDAETQSDDGKRVLVRLRNTNEYPVYVESTVTWSFEEGDDDSQTRSGPIGPSDTDERQYFTVRDGTVTEIEVTLPTVERV